MCDRFGPVIAPDEQGMPACGDGELVGGPGVQAIVAVAVQGARGRGEQQGCLGDDAGANGVGAGEDAVDRQGVEEWFERQARLAAP